MTVKRLSLDVTTLPRKESSYGGFELFAAESATVAPFFGQQEVKLGITLHIPTGFRGSIKPHPKLAATRFSVVWFCEQLIPPGEEYEVCLTLENGGARPYRVETGDLIARLTIAPCSAFGISSSSDYGQSSTRPPAAEVPAEDSSIMPGKNEVIVSFKLLTPNAKFPQKLQGVAAGCCDLYAAETVKIPARSYREVKLGLTIDIPAGYYAEICSKTDLAHLCKIFAFPGIITSDYTGEVSLLMKSEGTWEYEVCIGENIGQLMLLKCLPTVIEEAYGNTQSAAALNGLAGSASS